METREIRKLPRREHDRTRELYETVFSEDSRQFVDYYYDQVADENEIYTVEENGTICSMLHLNPYAVHLGSQVFDLHYIVAVATREAYRHQGMMKSLLKKALEDMREREEPFTFLMPADAAIYQPFGFTYISKRNYRVFEPKDYRGLPALENYPATMADVPDLAWISERILSQDYEVYTKRTETYFARLLDEQEAQRGEVVILAENRDPKGYLVYSAEDAHVEIRELAVEKGCEERVMGALADCFFYDEGVKMYGFPKSLETEDTIVTPFLMGRIVCLPALVKSLRRENPAEFFFRLTDDLLPENSGCYRCRIGKDGGELVRLDFSEELEAVTPGALLERLIPPDTVFLHEVV
ncbi:MAG: GNAT family N-acetyltransferase [Eubacteriales bacterium]|nr:GNAT family N-acetyltransferase [Eubacteriales bacterium]